MTWSTAPAKTTYSWIVDTGGGNLAKQVVGVPAINISYTPPVAHAPAPPPVIQLQAQDLNRGVGQVAQNQHNAFWVKIIKTELDDNVDLNDLLIGNFDGARPEIAGLKGGTEVEWQPLQFGQNGGVDEVSKSLDSPKPSVVYNFQFFKYLGKCDDDGLVDPLSGKNPGEESQLPFLDAQGKAFVTINKQVQYLSLVGQQIAGFNANEVAAVPEPQTWALMLAGLATVTGFARRQRR